MSSGSAKVAGTWCFVMAFESHKEKEGEVHFSSCALVVDFTCFVVAFWLLQEDLAEHRETSVNYFPAILQLLLHCKNVDTLREPLSSSSYFGWLVHGRKC